MCFSNSAYGLDMRVLITADYVWCRLLALAIVELPAPL